MSGLLQDVRYTLRQLRKSPGFTAVAVLTLALGIGANTAIFSFVYGALLEHLPYRHPEQLVNVWSSRRGHRNNASVADFLDWRRQSTVFESLTAFQFTHVSLAMNSSPPESALIARSTPGWHQSGEDPLALGREFLPEEGIPGKNYVVIISNNCWRHRFNADPHVMGRKISVNGEAYTIVGVMNPPPAEGQAGDDWVEIPLAFTPEEINRDDHWLTVEGRLKPGVTIPQATAELQTIAQQIAQANPSTNKDLTVVIVPREHAWVARHLRRTLYLLMGAVGFVLLIACANVANLLLARGTVRRREVAIRSSLGATRWQLITQFLTESMILAAIGAGLGMALAWSLIKIALALMPLNQLPSEAEVKLQAPVLLFAVGVASLAAILCGIAPALQSAQSRSDRNTQRRNQERDGHWWARCAATAGGWRDCARADIARGGRSRRAWLLEGRKRRSRISARSHLDVQPAARTAKEARPPQNARSDQRFLPVVDRETGIRSRSSRRASLAYAKRTRCRVGEYPSPSRGDRCRIPAPKVTATVFR